MLWPGLKESMKRFWEGPHCESQRGLAISKLKAAVWETQIPTFIWLIYLENVYAPSLELCSRWLTHKEKKHNKIVFKRIISNKQSYKNKPGA